MGELSGAHQFQQLSFEDQARYIAINQQKARFPRDHAVPIIFAPPRSRGGKINGASGSVLQLSSGLFIVTASHVLEGYETRIQAVLGVSFRPFAMIIMVAASCAFVNPAGFQTNLMVQNDGGYTFADFAKVGLPLTMLVGIVVLLVAPVVYSF